MHSVSELSVLKSRSLADQRAVVDELTTRFSRLTDRTAVQCAEVLKEGVVDLARERPEQVLRYLFLAIIAADIATVPYPEGRVRHMESLRELSATYGLSDKTIVYLSAYSENLVRCLAAVEKDGDG
jgi:hypothetical protein